MDDAQRTFLERIAQQSAKLLPRRKSYEEATAPWRARWAAAEKLAAPINPEPSCPAE